MPIGKYGGGNRGDGIQMEKIWKKNEKTNEGRKIWRKNIKVKKIFGEKNQMNKNGNVSNNNKSMESNE